MRLKPSAVHDMDKLHTYDAAMVADRMEKHSYISRTRKAKAG